MNKGELIEITGRGEDSRHQFKVDVKSPDSLAAEVVALLNARGLLPYWGLGSGIRRVKSAWRKIQFIDDKDGVQFRVVVYKELIEKHQIAGGIKTESGAISSESGTLNGTLNSKSGTLNPAARKVLGNQLDAAQDESTLKSTLKKTDRALIEIITRMPTATIVVMQDQLGITRDGVNKAIKRLKAAGIIRRVGPDKGGHWEIAKR